MVVGLLLSPSVVVGPLSSTGDKTHRGLNGRACYSNSGDRRCEDRFSDLFEAAGRVLVQQARDQRLIRQALRERSLLDRLQVLARQPDVQPPVLAERRLGVARVASSFALAAAGGLPLARSTDSSSSFSSASSFIVGLLTEVLLRGLPTRDDRLQEDRVLVLDERHQVHVVLALDDEDALASVTVRVRVLQDIEQVASLDVEDDFFEPDVALRPELRVLRVVPVEVLHRLQSSTMCAHKAHVGVGLSVPKSVPKRGPKTIIRQPTPTKRPIKNGPEIVNFRPVL